MMGEQLIDTYSYEHVKQRELQNLQGVAKIRATLTPWRSSGLDTLTALIMSATTDVDGLTGDEKTFVHSISGRSRP